jgi:hypothetical protein
MVKKVIMRPVKQPVIKIRHKRVINLNIDKKSY